MLLHDVITKDHFAHANDYLQDEGRGYPSNLVDFGNNNLNQLTSLPSRYLSSQSGIGHKSRSVHTWLQFFLIVQIAVHKIQTFRWLTSLKLHQKGHLKRRENEGRR